MSGITCFTIRIVVAVRVFNFHILARESGQRQHGLPNRFPIRTLNLRIDIFVDGRIGNDASECLALNLRKSILSKSILRYRLCTRDDGFGALLP